MEASEAVAKIGIAKVNLYITAMGSHRRSQRASSFVFRKGSQLLDKVELQAATATVLGQRCSVRFAVIRASLHTDAPLFPAFRPPCE